jgi:hypothetical protein
MMALTPEERAAVLALNPQARPQDLDRFEALLVERLEAVEADPAKAQALDRELKEMEARLFPRLQEALQQVWARRPEELEEPEEPGVA